MSPDIHSDAPPPREAATPRRSAGGRGGAALDLSGLDAAAWDALGKRISEGTFNAWAQTVEQVGYCAHPIRLVGRSHTYEVDTATGEIGDPVDSFSSDQAPMGVLYRACGNRRADVCPYCSRVYARDTFEMIRAGLVGGKTIPATVADNPLLFVTFTAPTFGPVHSHNSGKACRPRARDRGSRCPHGRPVACHARHAEGAPINGQPICGDCYDWATAVIWQWWAPELWRRTTTALRRAVAGALGVSESGLKRHASVQFAKVAEFQARGAVHFHALIRLDGPDGPGSPAPLDGRTLADLVRTSASALRVTVSRIDADDPERELAWGRQLDVRVVREGHRTDDPDGPLIPEQVAGYLAKYATKDANSIRGGIDAPRPHLARLASTCRELAGRARVHYGAGPDVNGDPVNPYRLLGKWAHMLGFRGHFATKSRRYSITLGRLRRARQRYQQLVHRARETGEHPDRLSTVELEARLLAEEDETTVVIGEWTYQGTGWTTPGDEALALAAAARAREYAHR